MVGIETIDRRKELTGPTQDARSCSEQYPSAGHSADFRRYIAEEVIPLVEARYRTDGNRGVIGESLAGLFIVESALAEPGLFRTITPPSARAYGGTTGGCRKERATCSAGKQRRTSIWRSAARGRRCRRVSTGWRRPLAALAPRQREAGARSRARICATRPPITR